MIRHIEGLHLWAIKTEPSLSATDTGHLLITTRRKDAGVAIHKAKTAVRKARKQNWIAVDVLAVNYEGTIDA